MEDPDGSSHAPSSLSLSDTATQYSYYDSTTWPQAINIPGCPQDLLPNIKVPSSASYPGVLAYDHTKLQFTAQDNILEDIGPLNQVNPDQIRNISIDAFTKPLDEQPYQVGYHRRLPPVPKWPSDPNHLSLNRSMTDPLHAHLDDMFSISESDIIASGIASYHSTGHETSPAMPRARTVFTAPSMRDSVIGSRALQRSISNNTGSQKSRGPGSTGTARRRSHGQPPPCPHCGKVLKNQSDVTKHAKSHTKPYKCHEPTCAKHVEGFSTPNDCDRHERSKHRKTSGDSKDQGYICIVCTSQGTRSGKWWPRRDNFKQHITKKHPEYKVEDVVNGSLRDRRPDDDNISMAPSNCFTASLADHDMQYQHDHSGLPPPPSILNSSQQGESLPWSTDPSAEFHDLAGVGEAQAADYLYGRKHHTITHGCHRVDKRSILSPPQPNIIQPVAHSIKNSADTQFITPSLPPASLPKHDDLTKNELSCSSNLDESTDCDTGISTTKKATRDCTTDVNNANRLQCKHKRCSSSFTRECDRRKHVQRHIRPYGCTWPKCYERHGSKSDWIRHESKLHMLADRWLCSFAVDDNGSECRTCFWKAEELHKHILRHHLSSHDDPAELVSEERIDSMLLGRRAQERFWCGFCCAVIENHVQAQGKDAWSARCDHIGMHIDSKGGRHINDWVCIEFMKTKSELLKEFKRSGRHPEPYNYEKHAPVTLADDYLTQAFMDVDKQAFIMDDALLPSLQNAAFAQVKTDQVKPEPV